MGEKEEETTQAIRPGSRSYTLSTTENEGDYGRNSSPDPYPCSGDTVTDYEAWRVWVRDELSYGEYK